MPLPHRGPNTPLLTLRRTPPEAALSSSPQPAGSGQKGKTASIRPLCLWTTNPGSPRDAQAPTRLNVPTAGKVCHWGTRRSLGSHGTSSSAACGPGTLGCWRLRRGLCLRERLRQKAAEIGRVKYCCRGNVAEHTSLPLRLGAPFLPSPTSWLQPLSLCDFCTGSFRFATLQRCSGTRCTAETRPSSLLPLGGAAGCWFSLAKQSSAAVSASDLSAELQSATPRACG